LVEWHALQQHDFSVPKEGEAQMSWGVPIHNVIKAMRTLITVLARKATPDGVKIERAIQD
jgi:hypothetical protein